MKWYRHSHFNKTANTSYYYDFLCPDMEAALLFAAFKFVPGGVIGEIADNI